MVVLSTASPYKFPASVLSAIAPEEAANLADEFEQMNLLSSLTGTEIPQALAELSALPERHLDVIPKDTMLEYVLNI